MVGPEEIQSLARDLCDFLVTYHHVRDVDGPSATRDDWRGWDVRFTFKGQRRHYTYTIERADPVGTMWQALRADTNGELLVRVPSGVGNELLTNAIFYPPHG